MLEEFSLRPRIFADGAAYSAAYMMEQSQNKAFCWDVLPSHYAQNIHRMRCIIENAQAGQPLDEMDVGKIVRGLYEDRELYLGVINKLEHLRPTKGSAAPLDSIQSLSVHCVNVALYSLAIAIWTRLCERRRKALLTGALLHDIGKIGINGQILNKPGKLNAKEFLVVKEHSVIGYDLACQAGFLDEIVCDSILMHHERLDGGGYPHGLRGDSVIDTARIIAIADTYDAVTSDHVYKCRSAPFEALRIMESMRKTRLDAWRTGEFIWNLAQLYMGSSVLLNTGELGEIVFICPTTPAEPIVLTGGRLLDLSQEKGLRVVALQ
ncbi:MAG: HD-GYP domain-containing protein [Peptococcaceae bacterium]|nr:HD-GYP domain-containing protein [Peptococcaceae bacterium]